MSAGAMVVMVPCPTGETAKGDVSLAHYADWLDGVVMHGGADAWPGSYGEEPLRPKWLGDRARDLYDLAVVEAFSQAGQAHFWGVPGLQLINVAFWRHALPRNLTQVPGAQVHRNAHAYDRHQHDIEVVGTARTRPGYPGVRTARVNSIHHQAIKDVAPGFTVDAWSMPDGIAEAIYRQNRSKSYVAATQWHPEFEIAECPTLNSRPLLDDFLAACALAKQRPAAATAPFRFVTGRPVCCGGPCCAYAKILIAVTASFTSAKAQKY